MLLLATVEVILTKPLIEAVDPWPEIDERIDLARAWERLTRKQREAMILWLQGYTLEEIGEKLGVGVRRVRYRLRNAKHRLRAILG